MVLYKSLSFLNISKKARLWEFVRFCIVGTICTGIDACVYYLLCNITYYQIALITGYLLSLVINYFLTVYWTFKSKPNINNIVGIIAAHIFNLFIVRMGLMFILVEMLQLNNQVSYIPTLIISVLSNYYIIKKVVEKYS